MKGKGSSICKGLGLGVGVRDKLPRELNGGHWGWTTHSKGEWGGDRDPDHM